MDKVKLLIILLILTLSASGSALANPQTTCPVQGGKVNKDIYLDYQGRRIHFCCPGCDVEFRKNPDKYLEKIKTLGVDLEPSPDTAKP